MKIFSNGNTCLHHWECELEHTLALSNNDDADHGSCSKNSTSKNTRSGISSNVHQETWTKMVTESFLWTANYPAGSYTLSTNKRMDKVCFILIMEQHVKMEWTSATHNNTNECHRHNLEQKSGQKKNPTWNYSTYIKLQYAKLHRYLRSESYMGEL